jgi:REP element-mobilizing transposase RayT
MPRPPRPQLPGGVYHVITRGNRRQRIFVARNDAPCFLGLLARVVRTLGWRCHDYCLMPNHYHAVVQTPAADLAVGMQRLNGVYAKWFNHHHGVEGHLFERRYRAIVIETDGQLLAVSRYLALNPVAAGLCDDPADWLWSSYRAMVGLDRPPEFLTCDRILSLFGSNLARARIAFKAFVAGDLPDADPRAWHQGLEAGPPEKPRQPKP